MRIFRRILTGLMVAIALAALVAVAAFSPIVQTWLVARALSGHPGLQASVGSVMAGFSSVHVENLRLQHEAIVLTLPELDAALPLKNALWDRQVLVRSLVAKGWTLDLSHAPAATGEAARVLVDAAPKDENRATAAPPGAEVLAQKVVSEFRGLLGGWELPCDATLDGVTLEGDVLMPPFAGQAPARVHVAIKGGGMAAGRGGEFTFDASIPAADSVMSSDAAAIHGRLVVAMASPRKINRIELESNLSSLEGSLPNDLGWSARVVAADSANEESYTLNLIRGGRHLATVAAGFAADERRFKGTWKIDLQESDLSGFHPGRSLPSCSTVGNGDFDADSAFTRVHAAGSVKAAAGRLGGLAPALDGLGAVSLEAGFELAHAGKSLQVERLSVSLVGTRPIAVARSAQPFSVDERTGNLRVADPDADWLTGSLEGFPVAWLSGLVDGLAFAGGDATGEFAVKAATGGFAVRSRAPFVATGVSVQRAGRMLGQGLDLSLALLAEHTPQGWQVQGAPLTIEGAGRRLARIEAKVSPSAEARARYAITGTWNADLEALASQPAFTGISPIKDRSTSGNFSVSVGNTMEVNTTINLVGANPAHSVTANVSAFVDAYGGVAFQVPVTITVGTKATRVSADGQWTKEKAGTRVEMALSGVDVALDHLNLLGTSLSAWAGIPWPVLPEAGTGETSGSVGTRDQYPFWGDWTGHVKFNFYSLRTEDHELNEVAGTLGLDHGAIRLEGGRAAIATARPVPVPAPKRETRGPAKADPPRNHVTAEGALSFDAAAEFPYSIRATAAVDIVDAARLFTLAQAEHDPVIEGRFSVADTLTSHGINLQNLVDRRREEFRLASKGGILRLLKTDVAQSIPDAPTPVKDVLATVGSAVGALFGVKKEYIDSGMNHLSKATQAVLDFTYQTPEIRYDQFTLTATRDADRAIHVTEIAINAPNERLTGSGQMDYVKGQPLRSQPLKLKLQLGVQGHIAQLLATAGLLSSDKDDQGYTLLQQPLQFGGTLEQIDKDQWRDLLVKAATPSPPDRGKKNR